MVTIKPAGTGSFILYISQRWAPFHNCSNKETLLSDVRNLNISNDKYINSEEINRTKPLNSNKDDLHNNNSEEFPTSLD